MIQIQASQRASQQITGTPSGVLWAAQGYSNQAVALGLESGSPYLGRLVAAIDEPYIMLLTDAHVTDLILVCMLLTVGTGRVPFDRRPGSTTAAITSLPRTTAASTAPLLPPHHCLASPLPPQHHCCHHITASHRITATSTAPLLPPICLTETCHRLVSCCLRSLWVTTSSQGWCIRRTCE